MRDEENKQSKNNKIIIIILLVSLLISAAVLAVRIIYLNVFADKSITVVVPDNLIGEDSTMLSNTPGILADDILHASDSELHSGENSGAAGQKAAVIELYKGQSSNNERFEAKNMFPGDTETKYFSVKISHHAEAVLIFRAEITGQTKNLADALHIKVTHLENKTVIYDGSFADMDINGYDETFAAAQSTETVASYKIDVSLPTSADNRYQAARLLADFEWLVKDKSVLDAPQTGDSGDIFFWFIVVIISVLMFCLLFFYRKKQEEGIEHANKK